VRKFLDPPHGPVATSSEAEAALFDLVDVYDRAFESAAAAVSLTAAQACLLGRLDEPHGMGALAEELGCDASNITQIVTRLEARGLVQREPNPEDRRSRQIVRTPSGGELYGAFEESFEFPRAAATKLTVAERKQLTALLHKALRR